MLDRSEQAAELTKCKVEQRISTFFKLKAISEKFQGKKKRSQILFLCKQFMNKRGFKIRK